MVEESGKDRSVACPNGKALRTICNWREGATSGTKLTSMVNLSFVDGRKNKLMSRLST